MTDFHTSINFFDHLIAVAFLFLVPLSASKNFYRVKNAVAEHPSIKIQLYRSSIIFLWTAVFFILIQWFWNDRYFSLLGISVHFGWSYLVGLLCVFATAAIMYWHFQHFNNDPEAAQRFKQKHDHIAVLFPGNKKEIGMFKTLSLTAGICEEIIYRGFLYGYLCAYVDFQIAVLISNIVFALAHSYQGVKSTMIIFLLGVVFSVSFIVLGTLWPAMMIHAMIDLYAGFLGYRVYRMKQ